jgi:hypothetical protein
MNLYFEVALNVRPYFSFSVTVLDSRCHGSERVTPAVRWRSDEWRHSDWVSRDTRDVRGSGLEPWWRCFLENGLPHRYPVQVKPQIVFTKKTLSRLVECVEHQYIESPMLYYSSQGDYRYISAAPRYKLRVWRIWAYIKCAAHLKQPTHKFLFLWHC